MREGVTGSILKKCGLLFETLLHWSRTLVLVLGRQVLAQGDWVLGAIHYGQQQSLEQITERILEAIRHPEVDAIAHPTGRLLLKREPYAVDLRRVMTTCAEYGKALEINANPMRLDLNDIQLMHATELGIPIVINSDAHSTDGLDVLRYGILQARRGGLTPSRVLNTLPLEDFLKWRETRKSGTARGISTEEDA